MPWDDGLEHGTPAHKLASSEARTIRALAGPGSGKSFAIKRRIQRLLEAGVPPEKILAITFTRTAAQDLRREISSLKISGADKVHARTVHSHALKILMKDNVLTATGRNPRMIIEHEQIPALYDIDSDEYGGVREKKDLLDSYLASWAKLQQDAAGFVRTETESNFQNSFIRWLSYHGGILVGEVIPIVIQYLRNNPSLPERDDYDYILVDEFQDLNKSEQEFIKLIRGNAELVIVGDDDQSIYGFKHAHPAGIQQVEELFGEYDDVPFDVCRRCPKNVTKMASELIKKNTNRTLGPLNHYESNSEGIVNIVQWNSYEEEVVGLSNFISNELNSKNISPGDVLILVPRRKIGYRLRDLLLTKNLPVKSYFRESVISENNVQRAFSLLNLLANPQDKISLRFLLGCNSGDYRKKQYAQLMDMAGSHQISVRDTLDKILRAELPDTHLTTIIREYRKILEELATLKIKISEDPSNCVQNSFVQNGDDETDFYEFDQIYRNSVGQIGTEWVGISPLNDEWLQKLMKLLLETIALPDSPEEINHIRIMSLHSSKGLSAKLVIMAGMIDNLIPFIKPTASELEKATIIEEARRLFYVAITRCKSSEDYEGRLIISSFIKIPSIQAARMGIVGSNTPEMRVFASRFISDFGSTSPTPIRGTELS